MFQCQAKAQVIDKKLCELRNILSNDKCYQTLYQKWDLYIPFIEFGTSQICAENGICTMIVPYPLTNQIYAQKQKAIIDIEYPVRISLR